MSGNAALAVMFCALVSGITAYNCMKLWVDHRETMAGVYDEPDEETT